MLLLDFFLFGLPVVGYSFFSLLLRLIERRRMRVGAQAYKAAIDYIKGNRRMQRRMHERKIFRLYERRNWR